MKVKAVGKKLLILGATGFIGRNLAKYFLNKSDYQIHAVANSTRPFSSNDIQWHEIDLTSGPQVNLLIKSIKPDILIQAAASTSGSNDIITNPSIHVTDNAVMNSYIFRSATEAHVNHLIFFSCTVMYPSGEKPIKEMEFDANEPIRSEYFGAAHTKLYLEKMCEFYSNLGKTKFTVVRHSNIYGPYDKFDLEKSHFLGATISKVMLARDKIRVWGSGLEKRDLLYVDDLCVFVDLAIKHQASSFEIYNCGSGVAVRLMDAVALIIKQSKKSLVIENELGKPSIPTALCLNYDKAKNELGWSPKISLEEGISKTISWWKKSIDTKTLLLKRELMMR